MPELPEVETVRRTLLPVLVGRTVRELEVLWPGSIGRLDAEEFGQRVRGAEFVDVVRRGKYLGLVLAPRRYLVAHLRMTGQLVVRPGPDTCPYERHLRVVFSLDNGHQLRFVDQRKFGRLYWGATEADFTRIAAVGPEPLSAEFTPKVLAQRLGNSRTQIKTALLDQHRIAGLGNIYADESLFRAGIRPTRQAGDLSSSEIEHLWRGIRVSLATALENGGTTLRDYVDGTGRQGENQYALLAYGRGGQPCSRCGGVMERTRVAGRSTVFCPTCQK